MRCKNVAPHSYSRAVAHIGWANCHTQSTNKQTAQESIKPCLQWFLCNNSCLHICLIVASAYLFIRWFGKLLFCVMLNIRSVAQIVQLMHNISCLVLTFLKERQARNDLNHLRKWLLNSKHINPLMTKCILLYLYVFNLELLRNKCLKELTLTFCP